MLNLQNDTYSKFLAFQVEYFVNLDDHFIFPFLHLYFSTLLMSMFVGAISLFYIVGIYYNIALFDAVR